MNGRGENIISDLPSCLKWKKYCRVSKSMLIHQAIRRHIIHHIATTEILKDLSAILEVILSNICTHTYTYTHIHLRHMHAYSPCLLFGCHMVVFF